jgi:hypothetical protein
MHKERDRRFIWGMNRNFLKIDRRQNGLKMNANRILDVSRRYTLLSSRILFMGIY